MRRGMPFLLVLPIAAACGTLGTADIVRARHAREFECSAERVHVIELGDGSLRAWGCGPDTRYVCRGGTLCSPTSHAIVRNSNGDAMQLGSSSSSSSSGGSTSSSSGASWSPGRSTARYGSSSTYNAPPPLPSRDGGSSASDPRGAQGSRRDAGGAAAATAPATSADAVRRLLEQRRSDVLVCTGRSTVGVRATYAADGSLDLMLQGELHGSPEEDCVRNALRDAHIPPPDHSGVVVHLIR